MEQQIRHRLAIQEAVSRVSRLFISSEPANLQEILQLIGEAVPVNRTYIFQLREKGTKMDNTHECCDPKTEPQINKLQDLDTARFPWWQKKLEKSENIVISDVNALPPDAASEKEDLRTQHIRALLAVPIYSAVDTLARFIVLMTQKNAVRGTLKTYGPFGSLRIWPGAIGSADERRQHCASQRKNITLCVS